MAKKLWARWEVTEVHSIEIEVDDDFDPDEVDWSSFLAEEEGSESYDYTPERDLLEYEVRED